MIALRRARAFGGAAGSLSARMAVTRAHDASDIAKMSCTSSPSGRNTTVLDSRHVAEAGARSHRSREESYGTASVRARTRETPAAVCASPYGNVPPEDHTHKSAASANSVRLQ